MIEFWLETDPWKILHRNLLQSRRYVSRWEYANKII